MHFHVENFNSETMFSLSEHGHGLSGMALKSFVETMEPINRLPRGSIIDFSEVDVSSTSEWFTWYGDSHNLYMRMLGNNRAIEANKYFEAVVEEAILLIKERLNCPTFELVSVTETDLIALNPYNVIFGLMGDHNRLLVFSIGESFAENIAKVMVDDSINKLDHEQLIKAAVAELGNMIVGLTLKHIMPYGDVKMSTPICFESIKGNLISSSVPLYVASCMSCVDGFKVYGINFSEG